MIGRAAQRVRKAARLISVWLVRPRAWWFNKVPLSVILLLLLSDGGPLNISVGLTFLLVVLTVCAVANYGYAINERYDVEEDGRAGRTNAALRLGQARIGAIILMSAALSFSDLMSWGIHDEYYVYFYHLLPNAPAAKPEFLARWNVETIDRRSRMLSYETTRGPDPLPRGRIVIGSRSFTSGDWVEMNAFSSFVRALHCHSLTRLIAIYLYSTHGIDYADFYEMLVNEFMKAIYKDGSLYVEVTSMYVSSLETDKILDDVEMDETVWGPCVLSIPRWIIVQICSNLDLFFDDLIEFLLRKMPTIENLQSISDFQENVIILPSYDCRFGKTFAIAHDWPSYFGVALKNSTRGALDEPAKLSASVAHASDTVCGGADSTRALDWFSLEGKARRRAWIQRVVSFRTLAPTGNLQSLSLESASPGAERELPTRVSTPIHSY